MKGLLLRLWQSPVIASWGSVGVRALAMPVQLPLLVTRLDASELTVWFQIAIIASFASIVDFGFSHTFYRLIAFGLGGAQRRDLIEGRPPDKRVNNPIPNWQLIGEVVSIMAYTYAFGALIVLIGLAGVGTWFLSDSVATLSNQNNIWIGWAAVVICSAIGFFGNALSNYLQGTDCITQTKRLDFSVQILATTTIIVLLALDARLAALLVGQQIWVLIGVARNWMQCRHVHGGAFKKFRLNRFDSALFRIALAPAWRTGLGAFASFLSMRACILYYSRITAPELAGAFLLAMQIMDRLVAFSMVPFYVRLPRLARLHYEDARESIIAEAKRGMYFSHFFLIAPGIVIALIGGPALEWIGSSVPFVGAAPWTCLLLAFVIQRYGAMHLQLYSTTNHIIWHWANVPAGIVTVIFFAASLEQLGGVYALVFALVVAYALIYCPIALTYSYRWLGISPVRFERNNILMFVVLMLFLGFVLFRQYGLE